MPDHGSTSPSAQEAPRGALAEADTLYAPSASAVLSGAKPERVALNRSSRFVLLAYSGLVTIVALVVLAIALRGSDSVTLLEEGASTNEAPLVDAGGVDASPLASSAAVPEPKPAPSRLTPDELDEARGKGTSALAALAEKYPDEPSLLASLMIAYAREKPTYAKSMSTARRLFAIAPEKVNDPDIERVMMMLANGPVDVATTALEIMSTSMGSRGPDLLYEIVLKPGIGKYPKERAARLLSDPAVKKIASPALVVANELRALSGCARRDLFARAATDGDERALVLIRPLLVTKGCAWHHQADCYTCFGDRAEVRATIDTITKRLAKAP